MPSPNIVTTSSNLEISLTPQVENLSSFRYPFLAGVVRCDEAECDGVEAGGRRQDFSEELKFTFKPSILLFKLSNLKIMHST